jgi:hypothetical protein
MISTFYVCWMLQVLNCGAVLYMIKIILQGNKTDWELQKLYRTTVAADTVQPAAGAGAGAGIDATPDSPSAHGSTVPTGESKGGDVRTKTASKSAELRNTYTSNKDGSAAGGSSGGDVPSRASRQPVAPSTSTPSSPPTQTAGNVVKQKMLFIKRKVKRMAEILKVLSVLVISEVVFVLIIFLGSAFDSALRYLVILTGVYVTNYLASFSSLLILVEMLKPEEAYRNVSKSRVASSPKEHQ